MSVTCGYTDTAAGQVHWRSHGRAGQQPALLLLPPAPFTSLFYAEVMPLLAAERQVVALDYPGYGGSFALSEPPTIAAYASAAREVANDLAAGSVDVMGFHSGCLVAAELTRLRGARVRRLVLIDVPAFTATERRALREQLTVPAAITPALDSVAPLWQQAVTKRVQTDGLDAALALFADSLRHGAAWPAAFAAAFDYDIDASLRALDAPCTIVATQSALLAATRRAADLVTGARLVERLDINASVMHAAAPAIAPTITAALLAA